MNKIFQLLSCSVVLLAFWGCNEEERSYIPYTKVDFTFSIYTHSELTAYGSIVLFPNHGYNNNGVFVCQLNMEGRNGYRAFDATCPNHGDAGYTRRLEVDPSGILKLKCRSCGSLFYLSDRYPKIQEYSVLERAFGNLYQVYH